LTPKQHNEREENQYQGNDNEPTMMESKEQAIRDDRDIEVKNETKEVRKNKMGFVSVYSEKLWEPTQEEVAYMDEFLKGNSHRNDDLVPDGDSNNLIHEILPSDLPKGTLDFLD